MPNLIGVRVAQPKTRNQIRKYTYQLRKELGLLQTEHFPIMHVLENVLPVLYPGFYVEPVEEKELQGRMAETIPEQGLIRVKESVYLAACDGDAWARMIMAHELGHFLFHNSQNTAYAYMENGCRLPSNVDPERQADIFAAELLIPMHLRQTRTSTRFRSILAFQGAQLRRRCDTQQRLSGDMIINPI